MKSEVTGVYFGLSHSYGWNFVTGVGEGKSILTTKEKPIYKNSGEAKTNRLHFFNLKQTGKRSDCYGGACLALFKFGWPLSESLQLLFQFTSLTFRDPWTGSRVQYIEITEEEYQKRGSRKSDSFVTTHYFYNIGIAYNIF